MSDVLFRDESNRVKKKFRPTKAGIEIQPQEERESSSGREHLITGTTLVKSRGSSPPDRSERLVDHSQEQMNLGPFDLEGSCTPRLLSPSLETIAVHFLLDDYLRSSHFQYLPSLYSTCHPESTLDLVLKAVAFSSLHQRSNRTDLAHRSHSYYTKGLTALNRALKDPNLASTDETLATVLLLALYATLNTSTTTEAWQTHTRGALALLSLRGDAQFTSKSGKAMFTQVSKMVMMSCIRVRTRVPDSLRTLIHDNNSHTDNTYQARTTLYGGTIFEDFVALHADMANGILIDPWEVVMQAEALLERLETLMLTLPGQEQYYRISSRVDGPGKGPWSVYLAQVWSNAWMAQLGLHEVVGRQFQALGLSEELSRLEAVRAAEDIFVAFAQLFPQTDVKIATSLMATSTPDPAAGFFSIWPLFNAGSSWCVDDAFRERVIAKLEYVGEVLSLPQATKAAQILAVGCRGMRGDGANVRNVSDSLGARFEDDMYHALEEAKLCTELLELHNSERALLASERGLQAASLSIAEAHSVGRITLLAYIFLPLTLVTGVFGMNLSSIDGIAMWRFWVTTWAIVLPAWGLALWTIRKQIQDFVMKRKNIAELAATPAAGAKEVSTGLKESCAKMAKGMARSKAREKGHSGV